jgi:hypothetical protein
VPSLWGVARGSVKDLVDISVRGDIADARDLRIVDLDVRIAGSGLRGASVQMTGIAGKSYEYIHGESRLCGLCAII